MGKVVTGTRMSLDGYINDRSESVAILYPDMANLRYTQPVKEAIQNTGAVVMGRNSYEMAEENYEWAGNYEFQVPIFVLTHHPPSRKPRETEALKFTFVTDGIESAIRQAKDAAGDKDVAVVWGASTANQALRAGLVDELQMEIMPVLLGGGLRPFEDTGLDQINLERTKVIVLPNGGTHIRFRVIR